MREIIVAIVLLVLVICGGLSGAAYQSWGNGKCYENGYPEFKWSFFGGKGYCIKRVDQTDIVTPIGDLK